MNALKTANLPHVVEVRGCGLMIGIELDCPYKEIRRRLLFEEHCFTGCSGTNVLRVLPPLCLTVDEAGQFVEKLKKVLA
jgi:acetylornithine aminotransferase